MAIPPEERTIEKLMARMRAGDQDAVGQLMDSLWPELRRLAAAKMRSERTDHTWQPTALVNELYLELMRVKPPGNGDAIYPNNKNSFLALAGHLMMRLLIHHARPLNRRVQRVSIEDRMRDRSMADQGLCEVESLLAGLARIDPQLRTIVEMKVFEGLSSDEVAARLNLSLRTVERRWTLARQWLAEEL